MDITKAPEFLEVRIKASKTDLFRIGVSVFLGVTGGDPCPIADNLDYMVRRWIHPHAGPICQCSESSSGQEGRGQRPLCQP